MSQTGQGIVVAYKVESAFNVAPGATGATRIRLNSSPGLSLQRTLITPGEIRADQLSPMGRLGSREVTGSYAGDLSLSSWDDFLEAVLRGTWVANVTINFSDVTSITTGTNTIVGASGSFVTLGVRVGDVIRLSGHAQAGNNDRNLRVTGVTASTITVAETLTVDAVGDAAGTITILRTLVNSATPTRRSFHIEEYNQDIDESELFGGCRIVGVTIRGGPDGMATIECQVLGASVDTLATGASPFFTTPTLDSTIGLVMADATLRYGGADIATLTAFELSAAIVAATQPVIGATVTPDVFDNRLNVTGSLSLVRGDLVNVDRFTDETELELHVLLVEPEAEPKDCLSIFVPRLKLTSAGSPLGDDGAMIETLPFIAGKKESVTGYDDTLLKFSTSAA